MLLCEYIWHTLAEKIWNHPHWTSPFLTEGCSQIEVFLHLKSTSMATGSADLIIPNHSVSSVTCYNKWNTFSYKEGSTVRVVHDYVIKWKYFPHYWPFVRVIHRSPVNSPHKGQWRALTFSLICAWINGWVNNREAGDLGRHRTHYDVTEMLWRRFQVTYLTPSLLSSKPIHFLWNNG